MRKLEVRGLLAFILTVLLVLAPFPGGLAFADETTSAPLTSTAVINKASPTVHVASPTALIGGAPLGYAERSLVQFNLSGLGLTGKAIKTSFLTLTLSNTPLTNTSQEVHFVTPSWTASSVTWKYTTGTTPWGTLGGDFTSGAVGGPQSAAGKSAPATLTWEILSDGLTHTNIPNEWLTTNNGLLIKDASESANPITPLETQKGSAPSTTSAVSSASIQAVSGNVYIAAIGLDASNRSVSSISGPGTGLTWALVQAYTVGNPNGMDVEIWKGTGTPSANGAVTATLSGKAASSIVVTRFSGVNTTPIGNTGTAGSGTSISPLATLTTANTNSVAIGAWSERSVTSTAGSNTVPDGTGFTLLGDSNTPTPGTGGVASEYGLVPAAQGPFSVGGALSVSAKWAAVAAELRQAPQTVPQYTTSPTLAVHYLSDATLGTISSSDPSAVSVQWTMPASGTYSGTIFTKRAGGAPANTPSDGTAYAVGSLVGSDAVVIHDNTTTGLVTVTDENGADSIVLPGTSYTYKGYARDDINISGSATTAPYYASGTTGSATTAAGGGTSKNWSYKTAGTALAPPGLNPNTGVVAVSNDNKVHSMSASTGGRNYQPSAVAGLTGAAVQSRPTIIPGTESTPTRADDVVYVGSQDGYVYAFNAASGAQLWKSALLGSGIQGSAAVQLKKYSTGFSPTVDLVIVGTRNTGDTVNNKIYGLNGDTGATVWTANSTSLGVSVDIISSMPMIDYSNNTVWVTSRAGSGGGQPSIFQLITNDGSKVRAVTLSTTVKDIDASPTLNTAGTFLYVVTGGSGAGQLVAVDTATGAPYASVAVSGSLGGAGYPIPVANGGSDDVYFVTSGASGGVYARSFDRTSHLFGTTLTWDRTDLSSVSTPVFMPPPGTLYLYVGDGAGVLHKLNPATGADVATRTVASTTLGDPGMDLVAIPNKLYVGGSNGRIYSFDLF